MIELGVKMVWLYFNRSTLVSSYVIREHRISMTIYSWLRHIVVPGDSLRSALHLIDAPDGYIVNSIKSQPWWQPSPYTVESELLAESIDFRVVYGLPSLITGNHLEVLYHMLNPHDPDWDFLRFATEVPVPLEQTARGIISIDQKGFVLLPGMGDNHNSTGLLAPDGTWAGMLPLAGEESPHYMMLPINYGSAYDGIYFDVSTGNNEDEGLWYRGYDSFRGRLETFVKAEEPLPIAFTVLPASPNPFNPSTTIEFILPEESPVTVTIFNALGQRVERNCRMVSLAWAGIELVWNAADFGPGLYFYRVETDAGVKTGKMMLVK